MRLAALLANFGRCLFKLFPWGFQGLPNPTLSNSMHNWDVPVASTPRKLAVRQRPWLQQLPGEIW